MTYNMMTSGRPQVIVDEAALQNMQQELARRGVDLERLRAAMESLSSVNEPERFMAAAMAACNQIAARWQAERVSLGVLKGRYVRVRALSHTEKITRQMQLVQDIEGAMEECLDQDVEVLYPPVPDASYVSRSTEKLSNKHGPSAVLSVPLRRAGEAQAVLTIERKAAAPFKLEDIETLRLVGDLVTARLLDLYEHDRWAGAKLAKGIRRGFAFAVGPKHTWAKVVALAVLGIAAFCTFVEGTYKVDANFALEVIEKRTVPAPYDGFLQDVNVEPGDIVSADAGKALGEINAMGGVLKPLGRNGGLIPRAVLATLHTEEFKIKRSTALAQKMAYEKQADIARRENKIGDAQVAEAQAKQAQTQVELYDYQIEQATLKSPVDGVVLSGDLKSKIGAPVKQGDTLFEVAPLESLRATLNVSDDQIAEVSLGQRGELATSSYPGQKLGFVVERINPVAKVITGKNVYEVRVKLDETRPWMRPGMEGVAKVTIRQEKWGWLLTHRVVKWVRMKLWW